LRNKQDKNKPNNIKIKKQNIFEVNTMGKTSSAVKNKYNAKTYTQFRAALKNDDYEKIEEIREATGLSKPEFIKMLVSERYDIKF
jgi:DNA-binding transcriptional regulator YiaG